MTRGSESAPPPSEDSPGALRTIAGSRDVYGERVSRDRIGGSVVAAVPIEMFGSPRWNVWAMTEYTHDQSNVDFFVSRLAAVTLGIGWRGLRQ